MGSKNSSTGKWYLLPILTIWVWFKTTIWWNRSNDSQSQPLTSVSRPRRSVVSICKDPQNKHTVMVPCWQSGWMLLLWNSWCVQKAVTSSTLSHGLIPSFRNLSVLSGAGTCEDPRYADIFMSIHGVNNFISNSLLPSNPFQHRLSQPFLIGTIGWNAVKGMAKWNRPQHWCWTSAQTNTREEAQLQSQASLPVLVGSFC